MKHRDRELGMGRPITRRDFLDGFRIAIAGSLLSPALADARGRRPPQAYAPEKGPGYYPPILTGMRGSHDGSWEVAHALRDGKSWDDVGAEADTGEAYDLVVVGGGISGLASAYFFRKAAGPRTRILVIENHDDFGGHAKRNEFHYGGRMLLSNGGTVNIDTPSSYSPEAIGLLKELGIELSRFESSYETGFYSKLGLQGAEFFDHETFGEDRLVLGRGKPSMKEYAARTPLSEPAQRSLARLYEEQKDYLSGSSPDEIVEHLARTSYGEYLEKAVGVDKGLIEYLRASTHGLFGVGIEAVPALDCFGLGYPGFAGIGIEKKAYPPMGATAKLHVSYHDNHVYQFPDGNASIARLLVRSLIPGAAEGHTMEDILTAKLSYARLDEESSPVRVRLNSTAVKVRHVRAGSGAKEVEVTYVRGGQPRKVRARSCVLACWNAVIPYILDELPDEQRKALAAARKVPLVYTSVLVRDWKAFAKLGISGARCPGGYFSGVRLDAPIHLGRYDHPRSPDDPMIVKLSRTPCSPGLPAPEQHVAGRYELVSTTFETFERNTRDLLGRVLSGGGFDPARDIEAITVNRWPHGYAWEYNSLVDPLYEKGKEPCVVARQPVGHISIANSDAGAYAYTNCAIDQAYRAVQEQIERV